jgi:hypothetical protein
MRAYNEIGAAPAPQRKAIMADFFEVAFMLSLPFILTSLILLIIYVIYVNLDDL